MNRYSQLCSDIWFNDEFMALSSDSRIAYIYMMSSPHSNMNGFYRLPMRYIQADLRITEAETKRLIQDLTEKKFIFYDNEIVLIRTYMKYNTPKSRTQLMGVGKALKSIPKGQLTIEFLYRVAMYCQGAYKWIDPGTLLYLKEHRTTESGIDVLSIYNNYLLLEKETETE